MLCCMNHGETDLNNTKKMAAYELGLLFQGGHCGVTIRPSVGSHIAHGPGKIDDNLMETYLEDGYLVMRVYSRINIIVADHN